MNSGNLISFGEKFRRTGVLLGIGVGLLALGMGGCARVSMNLAISNGDIAKVKRILDGGYKIDGISAFHPYTALMHAVGCGNMDITKLLIERGAKLEATDKNGATAIFYAVGNSNTEMARYLIGLGANVNARNEDGMTPLMYAAWFGSPTASRREMMAFLIDHGADVNAKDRHGTTALMLAAGVCDKDAVRLLVERQADINARNDQDITALVYAVLASYYQPKSAPEMYPFLSDDKTGLPTQKAFLLLPLEKIDIYQTVNGADQKLNGIETVRVGPWERGRLAVFKPGVHQLKATYSAEEATDQRSYRIKGEKIAIMFQAEGGRLYGLSYDVRPETDSRGSWHCQIEELAAGIAPRVTPPLVLVDVVGIERTERDPEGLLRAGKLAADNEYWLVTITLQNRSGLEAELRSPDPRIHLSRSSAADLALIDFIFPEKVDVLKTLSETFQSGLSEGFKFSLKVQPLEKKTITLVFEVPKTAAGGSLELHFLNSSAVSLKPV